MINYLSEFTKKPVFEKIAGLLPVSMCPFLFYNLTSYIFTLSNDGWFGWTKRHKDPTYRRTIQKADFKQKDINRQYPNEVLVRCPNPGKRVVAGIGPWPGEMIKIRILFADRFCPNNHRAGEEVLLDASEFNNRSLIYNSAFPEIFLQSQTGCSFKTAISHCEKGTCCTVSVSEIIFPCRYHKNKKDFSSDFFLPDRFCPHVFAGIYPHVLALMYDARVETEIKIQHPGKVGYIILSIKKVHRLKSDLLRRVVKLIQELLETVFYPFDLIDYRVEISVVQNGTNGCSLEKGKKYRVNMKNKKFLCPATFHALYPYFMLCAYGGNMSWGENTANNLIPCPDCVGTVYSVCCTRGEN